MDPLSVAIELAREAGALLLAMRGSPLDVHEKGQHGDLVTAADRASETLIANRLRRDFPRAAIFGEEGTADSGGGDERWIVDPLDGTTNYAHHYPMYCVSIGYELRGELTAGVIYAPELDELYAAERGGGATLNGARIGVSTVDAVAAALVCTGFMPSRYERNGPSFAALSRRAQGVRRDGAAALDLAFCAAGRFDAFWEFDLHPWDVAAGALIVREAGGRVTAIDGSPFSVDRPPVLASNGLIHQEMVASLAAAKT